MQRLVQLAMPWIESRWTEYPENWGACVARGSDGPNCTSTAPTQETNGERNRDELREELVPAEYKWSDLTDQELLVAF